jgi:thiol:disulfide interchange protein
MRIVPLHPARTGAPSPIMPLTLVKCFRFVLSALLLLLAAAGAPAMAQAPGSGLLKVTDAFKLRASAESPGKVRLHWRIADNYYLYRPDPCQGAQ